jgi:hypothetical protein
MATDKTQTEQLKLLARYKSVSGKKRGIERFYRVTLVVKTGLITCECPGFTYRGHCRHVDQWIDKLSERY